MLKEFSGFYKKLSGKSVPSEMLIDTEESTDADELYQDLIDFEWMSKQYENIDLKKVEFENLFRMGVDPNPYFDSDWYLLEYKDIAESGGDPLLHYVCFGEKEGRKPNPFFDPNLYLRRYPDLKDYKGSLLSHYIEFGIGEGRIIAEVDNRNEFQVAKILGLKNLEKFKTDFNGRKIAVVIPVFNNWSYTERCLRAIENTIDYELLQIYVVNDGSTDETLSELKRFPNVMVISTPSNMGYLKASNFAFSQLNDFEFLFLLNNDSEPLSGFVVNALEVMQAKKDVAIVGSMLFFADGKLQASGGLIRADGAAFHWGDLDSSKSPIYRVTRKVDYTPFAAVLIRNSDLIKVSGFDEQFAPAYYEDVDIAFKVRAIGKYVYVASESKVIHFGSKSYGAGKSDLLISLNRSNRQKFITKWKEALAADH